MQIELERELAHAASAASASSKEADERLDEWQRERAALEGRLERYEAEGEERSGKAAGRAVVFLGPRGAAQRSIATLDRQIAAASTLSARIDVEAIVRAKWEREPSQDELRAQLRRANHGQKHLESPELRQAAKRLIEDALTAAKRDLGAARAAYAEARQAGRRARSGTLWKTRSAKKRAIVVAFDERHGLG
jgi:hypothetical protein